MVRSSVADRYLKTLESNSLENAPKSPPKSIRSTNSVETTATSPQKPGASPVRSSPLEASKTNRNAPLRSSPLKNSSPLRGTSPLKSTSTSGATPLYLAKRSTETQKEQLVSSSPSRTTVTPSAVAPTSSLRSPVKSLANAKIDSALPTAKTSPIKYPSTTVVPKLTAVPATASVSPAKHQTLGPKPDRNPLMHNQDLTPSQVAWDRERHNWQAYEYLCHVVEAKEWMEKMLGETLPPAEEFPESLQNGISLAKLVKRLRPDLMKWPIFEHKRLQYRHTENVTLFFDLLQALKIPQLFQFDMTDLYEKRNLPKVIYCIHAISHFIAESEFAVSAVDNLVGKLEFSDAQLNTTEKGLAGRSIPNFGAMTRQLSGKQPKMDIPDYDDEEDDVTEGVKDTTADEDASLTGDVTPESVRPRDRSVSEDCSDSTLMPRTRPKEPTLSDAMSSMHFSDSEDDSMIDLKPPRRYRAKRRDVSESSMSSASSLSSLRQASRELYNDRYSQYDRRQYRGYGYRNLSSTGSLRSRVLSSAELMLIQLEELEPEIINFQAVCRRKLVQTKIDNFSKDSNTIQFVTKLQATARGVLARRYMMKTKCVLDESRLESLVKVQALARAFLVKRSFSSTSTKVNDIVKFQDLARGYLFRRQLSRFRKELASKESIKAITSLESVFRGVILRFKLSCLYDDLDQHILQIVQFQALMRGVLARRNRNSAQKLWEINIDKVVLLQSVWRAKTQGSRYQTLIAGSNPSLQAIKPFLHLIDDKPEDFERELELEKLVQEVGERVHENERLEARIDQLDMKVSLLVKNNINIDEVVLQHQKQSQDFRQQHRSNNDKDNHTSAGGVGFPKHTRRGVSRDTGLKEQFDANTLQKTSRERIELYQGLLYVLQVQPEYFTRLMMRKPPKSLDMAELVLSAFEGAFASREQFLLLRQLSYTITHSNVGSSENTVAWSIVSHLNKRKESTDVAKKILKPATEKLKACYDQLLEYDPHIIYDNLTGGADLSAEEAIQDPAVRALFVQNLQRLREITMALVQTLAANMHELPYHVKFLARESYHEVLNVTKDRRLAIASIGQVIISQFVQPALLSADSLDLVDAAAGNTSKNLALISRVIHQVGLMVPFNAMGSTDIYLQPLNEFVKSSAHHLSLQFQSNIIDCEDISSHFNFYEYDDIMKHERPVLNINMDHILALHNMCFCYLSAIVSANDKMLKPIIEQLGPLPKDARELLDLARFKEIQLELNPKYSTASLNDSVSGPSSLMMTTKRCLGYVLRVQSNQPDLMSVLVAPVELEDEHSFNLLLDSDNTREVAGELGKLSFRELKLLTLEKILELESSGIVSRKDGYQALINAIADDIRNKDSLRQKKLSMIEAKRRTLAGLKEKCEFLQNRLETYSVHIEKAMTRLQTEAFQANTAKSKRGFQLFQLPTSKPSATTPSSKNGPKFGQFRTTADKLYERGILIRLRGYEDRQRKDVQFIFSSDKVGLFQMDILYKGILLPNGSISITLDDLLARQYENKSQINLMNNELYFSTNRFAQLIFHKFLGTM